MSIEKNFAMRDETTWPGTPPKAAARKANAHVIPFNILAGQH
jgi:hypothetical protein